MTTKNTRNSRIESLRILAIIMITFNHIYGKGVDAAVVASAHDSLNAAITIFFSMGGKFGCNIFLIISAWFLSEKDIEWNAVIRIWLQTVFYSLILDIVSTVFYRATMGTKDILAVFLPLTIGTYWYSTAYVIMLIFGPISRTLFDKIKKGKAVTLVCMGGVLSILPTVTMMGMVLPSSQWVDVLFKMITWPPFWFLYVYLLIYYIKSKKLHFKPAFSGAIFVGLYILMYIGTYLLFRTEADGNFQARIVFSILRNLYSPICFCSALFLFFTVLSSQPCTNNWINLLGTYTYGIYLFQCHKTFQTILWKKILVFEKFFFDSTAAFILYSIYGVMVILILGIIMDWGFKLVFQFGERMVKKSRRG